MRFWNVMVAGMILAAGPVTGAGGATWRVERDGSGDFTTLQPALDACAAGDTVLIGPGEYPEMTPQYLPNAGGWLDISGLVKDPDLTLIGSGPDDTIVGPAAYAGRESKAIAFDLSGDLRIENLTLRNSGNGIWLDYGRLFVEGCHFLGNETGIGWYSSGEGGGVWNSHFHSTILYNHGITLLGTGTGIVIEGCTLEVSSLLFHAVQGVVVQGCDLFDGGLGVQLQGGAAIEFHGCRIYDKTGVGIGMVPGYSRAVIQDCEISGGMDAVNVTGYGNELVVTNSILTGGSRSVVKLDNPGPANIRYSELHKGSSDIIVLCSQYDDTGGVSHDFRGNYWGTTNPDQIAEWIWDRHDDPVWANAEVLYTPFATGDTDLVIALSPIDPEILIPACGGSFQYDASIENNTAGDIVADLAIEAVMPDGTSYPVMTLPGVLLAGASVRTRIGIVQEVPAAAPAGAYTYRVSASLGDTLLVDAGEFPFEKQGGAVAASGDLRWPVIGWEEESEDRPSLPEGSLAFVLHEAVPNPFNPTTTVAFDLPAPETVSLLVFDVKGRLVRTLLDRQTFPQGRHEVRWDGRDQAGGQAASGTYFFRLEGGGRGRTTRGVLLK
ncbi:right-handed parallel beta-helix repeat-containing protein [bacterium]|nr:right-handed parallel beta-helix repeat-containing protein [bacterium]